MALARVKTWVAGEVLTASDLNAEFNNILNNATSLVSPLIANLDFGGFSLIALSRGSVTAPGLAFTGDTNTGLFSRGADEVGFTAGGATAFSVLARVAGTTYAEFKRDGSVGERFYPVIAFGGTDDGVMSVTTGTVDLVAGGRRVLQASAYAQATNYLLVSPSQVGAAVRLETAGADTNVGLVLDTKGTGVLTLGSTDTGSITAATGFLPIGIAQADTPSSSALYTQNVPKAWVNFTGRSTNGAAAINSAFNVASVQRTAAGDYTITYRRAFAAASNYAVLGSAFIAGNTAVVMGLTAVPTTTTALVKFFSTNILENIDPHEAMVTVMGNQ